MNHASNLSRHPTGNRFVVESDRFDGGKQHAALSNGPMPRHRAKLLLEELVLKTENRAHGGRSLRMRPLGRECHKIAEVKGSRVSWLRCIMPGCEETVSGVATVQRGDRPCANRR